MSSSTEITFSFSSLTSLEVVTGSSAVADYMGVAANQKKTFSNKEALDLMQNSNIISALSRFDQAIVNLLIDQQESHEEQRKHYVELARGIDRPEDVHAGVYLTIRHCR
ncbi:hypothetical protein HOS33_gp264 [Erwinia phage vB_EamM_Y3]|uniref:Uncharacterized protein n=1 Tax=Erwinia phage vB_EamM_Y3 TaxID=1983553 RepID=A0A2H4IBJ9_9CAUD|nr:hypothetical protein HOS33_gp264 [Erwinia phage vB_EamM_Y3]ARW58904.1 hypothetical protein Y3_264 [Erwinia phage vB_EamM_Y3]QZE56123.1 hypothetical protein pEaSNUABM52_00265 [Erwinia phage pEp_SNUABM_52]